MIVTFFDRQDKANPDNGLMYSDAKPLLEHLNRLSSRPAFLCELEGENGFKLLVGVHRKWSCIQHSRTGGAPPYLMAVPKESQSDARDMEFLIGNTQTPISRRHILRLELAREVISVFVQMGERAESVGWEEI
jgi:hypothetical protein